MQPSGIDKGVNLGGEHIYNPPPPTFCALLRKYFDISATIYMEQYMVINISSFKLQRQRLQTYLNYFYMKI
jgi:hypothetical protein